jgi:hypothetical protein
MAFRDILKANLDVALASTSVSTSAELPFDSADQPLHEKNMKKVYLDSDNIIKEPLVEVLSFDHVIQTTTSVMVYLSVDAKNPLTDIDTVTDAIINSRFAVTGQNARTVDMSTTFNADKLIYQFEFNFTTI